MRFAFYREAGIHGHDRAVRKRSNPADDAKWFNTVGAYNKNNVA